MRTACPSPRSRPRAYRPGTWPKNIKAADSGTHSFYKEEAIPPIMHGRLTEGVARAPVKHTRSLLQPSETRQYGAGEPVPLYLSGASAQIQRTDDLRSIACLRTSDRGPGNGPRETITRISNSAMSISIIGGVRSMMET